MVTESSVFPRFLPFAQGAAFFSKGSWTKPLARQWRFWQAY